MKKIKITKRDIEIYNSIPQWLDDNKRFLANLDKVCSTLIWLWVAIEFFRIIIPSAAIALFLVVL